VSLGGHKHEACKACQTVSSSTSASLASLARLIFEWGFDPI